jgi:hypothetical protein
MNTKVQPYKTKPKSFFHSYKFSSNPTLVKYFVTKILGTDMLKDLEKSKHKIIIFSCTQDLDSIVLTEGYFATISN